MIHVALRTQLSNVSPQVAFERLRDFSKYPGLTEVVQHVDVSAADGDSVVSSWAINFRGGILKWQERDEFDVARLQIRFKQLQGDLKAFAGTWSVTQADAATQVEFSGQADLGIPSLAPLLEPAAERALTQAIEQILNGLFGPGLRFTAPDSVAAE